VRIGICGELVSEGGLIKTIKNFTSVNIRVPHEVANCCLNAFRHIVDGQVHNTLIISPPGAGKTTVLRDIAVRLSNCIPPQNVLILDERSEIAAVCNGIAQLNAGLYSDVMTNCGKAYGFEHGIRSMRPDVIITDELANAADLDAAAYAMASGVKVIASVHACDHLDIAVKPHFESAVKRRLFGRYVVLSDRRGPGTYEGIYDAQFNPLT
jgi:stage III sporulation protein AA